MFNFSATFTDDWDIFTTVSNFNLSEFIKWWYWKNIVISNQEYREFNWKIKDDYSNTDKQKIVLKSLLTLTVIKKYFEKIKAIDESFYHNPLMITIWNSVFTENSDLEMFFKELKNIWEWNVDNDVFVECINVLVSDFRNKFEYLYLEEKKPTDTALKTFLTELWQITLKDILKYVYNSNSHWGIEYQKVIWNDKEITFKLKWCDDPFAMIKIWSISKWSNDKLVWYTQSKTPFSENTFDKLNDKNSKINILLWATSFYEWWDSNRPNIINFINMWLSDAQKFVLQTIGRWIRINPVWEERQRLNVIKSSLLSKSDTPYIKDLKRRLSDDKYNKLKDIVFPLETLFLFSTKKDELQSIVEELNKSKTNRDDFTSIWEYFKRNDIWFELYYPIYKEKKLDYLNKKYSITRENLDNIKEYVDEKWDNLLLLDDELSINSLLLLKELLNDENKYFAISNLTEMKFTKYLLQDILNFFNFKDSFIDNFQLVWTDQIVSFKNISVNISDKRNFDEFILSLNNSKKQLYTEEQLDDLFDKWEITKEEYKKQIKFSWEVVNSFKYDNKRISIKNIAKHYYTPLIVSQWEKVEWLKHVIDIESEIDFIDNLEQQEELLNQKYDDWMFCKLDETLDKSIFIPYMNKEKEKSKFIPDFVFWFKKGNDYKIVFIDPKWLSFVDYQNKIDWYKDLFEWKIFDRWDHRINVELFMYNKDLWDRNVSDEYKKYWFNDISMIL